MAAKRTKKKTVTKKRAVDRRYEPSPDRRGKPIGVFAPNEEGRHRFMEAVRRIGSIFGRRRSRLDVLAFARGDALIFGLAVLLEKARLEHGYTPESVNALLKRIRKTPESFQ
jgi:hypothetical protein